MNRLRWLPLILLVTSAAHAKVWKISARPSLCHKRSQSEEIFSRLLKSLMTAQRSALPWLVLFT